MLLKLSGNREAATGISPVQASDSEVDSSGSAATGKKRPRRTRKRFRIFPRPLRQRQSSQETIHELMSSQESQNIKPSQKSQETTASEEIIRVEESQESAIITVEESQEPAL